MSLLTYSLLKRRIDELETRLPGAPIYGVYWDKGPDPTLIRTHDAVGMEAAVGVEGEWVHNDFDRAEIFGEMGPVTDDYGNVFIRIPKFYIRKTDGPGYKTWAVSKHQYPGFYRPWCFWDFERGVELPYVDVGKYKASLGSGNRLESKPDTHPLVNANVVTFRSYARNNNAGGRKGYQQLDIHVYDVLQTLMYIEFATLNLQSVMQGFVSGANSADHVAVVSEANTNRIVISTTHANDFRVGQSIGIGTSVSSNAVAGPRVVLEINDLGDGKSEIVFDGDPVNISEGNVVASRGWLNGFSKNIASSSGCIGANGGKYPCSYRGIESPYGDLWQWVDGVNINDHQSWVCKDAEQYASNLFASPYEKLGYVNGDTEGYVTRMGFDPVFPFAEFPVETGGSYTTYYSDFYAQATGQRIAYVGGSWSYGSYSGPACWYSNASSSFLSVATGGRLVRKAVGV